MRCESLQDTASCNIHHNRRGEIQEYFRMPEYKSLLSSALLREYQKKATSNNSPGNALLENKKMKSNSKSKAIKRGDRILTEKPFVYVLKSTYRQERCDHCLSAGKVLKCSNCHYVYYCNRACQLEAWQLHKIECPFLKRIHPRTVPDAARVLCKLIIKLDKGGDLERGYYMENCSRRFRDLMSHYAEIKNDSKRMEHLESLYVVLKDMMQDSAIVPNITELASIYGRLVTNGFNILDAEMNSIATAIYLGVSVTDHNCQPNAVATFEGTTLHVHATEDMECLDWSKIFISYIDLLNTPEQRRADLKANYYFLCICSKCVDPQETLEMNAAACANPRCAEYVDIALHNCPRCGTAISPKQRNAYQETITLTKSHLDNMKDIAYLDACALCLKKQIGVLHPLNLWHIKTLDAAFEAAIAVSKWKLALEYGNQLLPGFRKYYGDWNPLLGLLYFKLGKLQLYQCQLKEAVHNLQEARKILEVTHGRDHSLIREQLLPMLLQATTESSEQ